jgi:hypothetical protein
MAASADGAGAGQAAGLLRGVALSRGEETLHQAEVHRAELLQATRSVREAPGSTGAARRPVGLARPTG